MIRYLVSWVALLALATAVSVAMNTAVAQNLQAYQFEEPAKEALFRELINELRCPKCQNQSIADSNADLSKDLRDKTYEMVKNGATKQEVLDYMRARYGDFVHYKPPVTVGTSILWWGPLAVLVIGLFVILIRLRQQKEESIEMTAADKARLEALKQMRDDGDRN